MTNSLATLPDIAAPKTPPSGQTFWAAFNYVNGETGTFCGTAANTDEFIAQVVALHRDRIARFTEIQCHAQGWPRVPNEQIRVTPYNKLLPIMRRVQKNTSAGRS